MSMMIKIEGSRTEIDTGDCLSMKDLQDDGLRMMLALNAHMRDLEKNGTQPEAMRTARLVTLGVWGAYIKKMERECKKGMKSHSRMTAKKITADILGGLVTGEPEKVEESNHGDGADQQVQA